MPKTCFIIGPIGGRGDEIRAHADDVIKYIIEPSEVLKHLDYGKPIRADRFSDPGRITPQIIECLRTADLVIADLTFNNPNVYYELSLRHAFGKRAIHMCHDGTKPSFDVLDNRTIFFTFHIQRVEAAREELERQITRTHEPDYKVRNPIVDTVSLIHLEQSSQPVERHLAKLSRDVEQLNLEIQTIKTTLNLSVQNAEDSYLASRARTMNDILAGRRGSVNLRPFSGDGREGYAFIHRGIPEGPLGATGDEPLGATSDQPSLKGQ
jgi:hypothetical protein